MAEPAAVPGVDPSRVNTPDELAACLDGLRRRRGLSYEVMADLAARLPSRSGRSRPEPLPRSTVGEIVTGKRLPTKGKLLTFLAVCQVAPADLAQWLAAWERASTAGLARPADGVRVRDARPRLLGVHDAIQVDGKVPGELPVYVSRDIDDGLRAELAANAQRGCFVLLIGGSSVGKTRTLYEAVLTALPDWWLVHPAGPDEVTALAQTPTPRTVVWLDELQRYLDGQHGLTGAVVRAFLASTQPAVMIGTLWPDRYNTYAAVPAPGAADPHAREREVLDLATVIRIAPEFSPAEEDRARVAASRDRRLAVALEAGGYGLTQTLAAAPQLVARWQDARTADPYAWAVLTAALDATRLGARAPLDADLLRAAAPGYCTSRQQAEAPGSWFEKALAYATEELLGAAAALSPAGTGMGQIAGYTVADYLVQHVAKERRHARVPASTWDAVLSRICDPADTVRLADSARNRLLYRYAIPLYRRAADAGDEHAALLLAELLEQRGDLDQAVQIFRARADAGDRNAAGNLVNLLIGHGDLDWAVRMLRARADAGDDYAANQLAVLLAKRGELNELRARADTGDAPAALRLAELLADRGDLDRAVQILRAPADRAVQRLLAPDDTSDRYAAWQLADLLIRRGDLDELRARADTGDWYAAWRLADLLGDRSDLDRAVQLLRVPADAGDVNAASMLAKLLIKRGDLDELRARADTGDTDAAATLADLLVERGDLDELRARADAGDIQTAWRLADLLIKRGDLDELRARADAGDEPAVDRLTGLLFERGDLDELRARADAGGELAAGRLDTRLTELLVERGDLDGLRARADAGDWYAARRLADLLVERGDSDGLRARAEAGDWHARRLEELLVKQGRDEEAKRLRRFGLNLDGSTASS